MQLLFLFKLFFYEQVKINTWTFAFTKKEDKYVII